MTHSTRTLRNDTDGSPWVAELLGYCLPRVNQAGDNIGQEPAIHAIAVTFHRVDVLADTLEAFRAQTRPPDSILIVDNGSEQTVRDFAAGLPDTEYRAMVENLGPAGAIAEGMRAVLEFADDGDWVLLIDDDDPPPFDTAVEDLLQLACDSPNDVAAVGLTGPRYNRWTGRLTRVVDDDLADPTEVDYVGNNQVPLYRVRALRDVGVFDPSIFIFFEELEFGLRLRAHGWRIIVSREVTLRTREVKGRSGLGRHARSDRRTGTWRSYNAARNEVLVARAHGRWTAMPVVTVRVLLGGIRYACRTRSLDVLRPRVRGVADGWRGRSGRVVAP